MKPRSIAFYIDTAPLQREWGLDLHSYPLSGTDFTVLRVASRLAQTGLRVHIFCTKLPSDTRQETTAAPTCHQVLSLTQAHESCEAQEIPVLVFPIKNTTNERQLLRKPRSQTKIWAWAHNPPTARWLYQATNSTTLEYLIAVTHGQATHWAEFSLKGKVVVIPNFTNEFIQNTSKEEKKTISFIGAMRHSKGFHHVAKVWPTIHTLHPKWRLNIYGSADLYVGKDKLGPYQLSEENYEKEILAPLGGTPDSATKINAHFMGSIPRKKLFEEIFNSDFAIVNPNTTGSIETFCLSAVEALSLGVPIIGGNAGALRETVGHNVGGILVKNSEELTNAISRLITNPTLRIQLGKQGQENSIKKYSEGAVIRQWELLINNSPQNRQIINAKYTARYYRLRTIIGLILPRFLKGIMAYAIDFKRGIKQNGG